MTDEPTTPNDPRDDSRLASSIPAGLWTLAVLILGGALAWIGTTPAAAPLTFTAESEMHIDGTSNVHDWTCDVSTVNGKLVTDTAAASSSAGPAVQNALVRVPLKSVDCGRDGMTENLREALAAKKYPQILYRLSSAEVAPHPDSTGWFQVTATGPLTVAGSTRTVEMTAAGRQLDEGGLRIAGETSLDMTNYGVEPPTAMLGALKTGKKVTVRFDVTAAPQP